MHKKLLSIFSAMVLIGSVLSASSAFAQQPAPPPAGGGPDFSKATEVLGLSAADISAAIGGPPPDFVAGAEKLGIPVAELIAVLPAPPAADIPEGFTADDFMKAE